MQFKAKDGSSHSSQMKAFQHGAQDPAASDTQPSGQPKSIQDDPAAMECVDKLQQMGYTADDVAQAMGDLGGSDQSQGGQAATQAAPLQIPGMQ